LQEDVTPEGFGRLISSGTDHDPGKTTVIDERQRPLACDGFVAAVPHNGAQRSI
jgi:hypothetical protein